MKKWSVGVALAAISLSLSAVSYAGTTPEATLKDFLTAMQKKDEKTLRGSFDWDAMAKGMGVDKEKDPEKKKNMMDQLQIIFVKGFAMGKQAEGLKVGPIVAKGSEATGYFQRLDPATKKYTNSTELVLHKKGKDWLISNITLAVKKK